MNYQREPGFPFWHERFPFPPTSKERNHLIGGAPRRMMALIKKPCFEAPRAEGTKGFVLASGEIKMRISAVIFAVSVLAATSAEARQVRPGQYIVGGLQGICVLNNGTWYGTTFSNWGGNWQYFPNLNTTFFYGNYADGDGNDTISVRRRAVAWIEWRDDLSFQNILAPTSLQRVGRHCDPRATSEAEDEGGNPLDAD